MANVVPKLQSIVSFHDDRAVESNDATCEATSIANEVGAGEQITKSGEFVVSHPDLIFRLGKSGCF